MRLNGRFTRLRIVWCESLDRKCYGRGFLLDQRNDEDGRRNDALKSFYANAHQFDYLNWMSEECGLRDTFIFDISFIDLSWTLAEEFE